MELVKKRIFIALATIVAITFSFGFSNEKASAAYLDHFVLISQPAKNTAEHSFGFHASDSPGLEGRAVRYKIVNSSGTIVESGSTTLFLNYKDGNKYVYGTQFIRSNLPGGTGTVYKIIYDVKVGTVTYVASGHITVN